MPGFEEFSQRFHDLIRKTDSADVRVPEDSALIGLAADLVPTISGLLASGIELLTDIEAHYGLPPGAVEVPDTLSQIGVQISLEWRNGDRRDPAVGGKLWQDLSAFADILVHVSLRQELMEHDLALVSKAYRTLFPYGTATARRAAGVTAATVPETLVGELQSLLGLDDELDRLILQGSDGSVAAWRQPLRRLQTSLSRASLPADRLDLLS